MVRRFGSIGIGLRCQIGLCLMTVGLLVFLPGCSPRDTRPKPVPVKGIVTLRGKPLAKAQVNFFAKGASMPASGESNDAGEFELTMFAKGDGALVGENKVTVVSLGGGSGGITTPDPTKIAKGDAQQLPDASIPQVQSGADAIPKVYSIVSQTPLTWTVKPEGNSDVKLELK